MHKRLAGSKLFSKLSPDVLKGIYPLNYSRSSKLSRRNKTIFQYLHQQNIHRFLGVPLMQDSELVGTLNVVRENQSSCFTPEDLKHLTLMGNLIVKAFRTPTEEKLEHSQRFLEAIVDNIPNPVFIKDRKHRWVLLNRALSDLVGYPRDKMLGKSDFDFFPKEQADFFWKKDEEMFRAGKVIDIPEEPITDKNGRIHYLHTQKAPLRNSTGKTTHIVGIIEDITERKRTEKDLILKEQIARERAQLLTDLRVLNQEDHILTRVCEAIRDSELFERAVMTLHDRSRQITHLGQVGLPRKMIKLARKAPPLNRKQIAHITSKRFRILDSFFIPVEAGVDLSNSDRYIPQKKRPSHADWQAGDELFVPLRDYSGRIMGYLSVDTPIDGCRPDLMKIQALEMLVEAAASRIRQLNAQKALQESEEKYRLLVENLKEGIYSTHQGIFINVNKSMCRMFGYSQQELVGMPAWNLSVPDKMDFVKKLFFEKTAKRDYAPVEVECRRKDGSKFFAEIKISAVSEKQQFLGVVSDITKRKRTEEELLQSQIKYKTLIEQIPAHTYTAAINDTSTSLYLSPQIEKIIGYTPKDFQRDPDLWQKRLHPEDRKRVLNELKHSHTSGEPFVSEYRMIHRKGNPVWVRDEAVLVRDQTGKPIFLQGVITNINDRKTAEEERHRIEEKYRLVVENANEAIVIAQEGYLKFVNLKMIEILGFSEKELLSKPFVELIHPENRKMVLERHRRRIKGEDVPPVYDFRVIDKKGNVKWLEINAVAVSWEDKPATLNFLTDITKRKQDEQLKEQYHEQKMLFGLTQALTTAADLNHLLKIAARKVTELLRIERSSIILVNPDGKSATFRALHVQKGYTASGLLGYTFKTDTFVQLKRLVLNKPFVVNDTSVLPKSSFIGSFFARIGIKSNLSVPLISRGKFLGSLTVATKVKYHTFSSTEIRLLQIIANTIAVTIENYQLLENLKLQASKLKDQTKDKDILLKISQALSQTMELDEVTNVSSEVISTALGIDRCAVMLLTKDGKYIEVTGMFSKFRAGTQNLIGKQYPVNIEPYWRNIITKGKVLVIKDTSLSPSGNIIKEQYLKEGLKSLLATGMFTGEKLVGVLALSSLKEHRNFTPDEIKLVQTIANQIAVAIENARLMQVVKTHTHQLKELSSQLMKAQEGERKRIAQELHDQVGQMLQSMKMNLDRIKKNLSSAPPRTVNIEDWLVDTEKLLSQTIDDIRTLTFDLRPSMLDDFGLYSTLRWYIDDYTRRTNVKMILKGKEEKYRFPLEIEVNLYRIIQEALTNVAKHAHATEVVIFLSRKHTTANLSVKDNGKGFDVSKLLSSPHKGTGIFNMNERVNLLGGSFEIVSKPGKGTRVNVNIPFTEVKDEEG